LTAQVISLARYRRDRAQAERARKRLHLEGSTLVLGDQRVPLDERRCRSFAEAVSDALDGRPCVCAAGIVIQSRGDGFEVLGQRVTRAQLAGVGLGLLLEVRRG